MSESDRSAETDLEIKAQETIEKGLEEPQAPQEVQENGQGAPDPYCCTPVGGDGGPDT